MTTREIFKKRIHFPDGVWTYKVGSWNILIRDPEGEVTRASLRDVIGPDEGSQSFINGERAEHPSWDMAWTGVKPAQIRCFITENLR